MFPKFRSITVIGCFQERNVVLEWAATHGEKPWHKEWLWGRLGEDESPLECPSGSALGSNPWCMLSKLVLCYMPKKIIKFIKIL